MKTRVSLAVIAVVMLSLAVPAVPFAGEGRFMFETSHDIKAVLTAQSGNRVAVRTDAGETIEGTVTKVGDHLVHLSKLSGRDYYDAVVRIDRISSVVVKAR